MDGVVGAFISVMDAGGDNGGDDNDDDANCGMLARRKNCENGKGLDKYLNELRLMP